MLIDAVARCISWPGSCWSPSTAPARRRDERAIATDSVSMIAVSRSQRLEVLDLARGAGFLIVLIQHSLGLLGSTVPERFVPQDATILDFFFILSGFFAGYAYEKKLRDGRKTVSAALLERAVRLFPLAAFGTFLGLVSLLLSSPDSHALPRLLSLTLEGSFLIPAHGIGLSLGDPADLFPLNGPLWFLLYDSLAYLAFLVFLRRLPLGWLVTIAALAIIGLWDGAITHNTLNFGFRWDDILWSIPRSLAGFSIGYILFRLYRPGRFIVGSRVALLPVLALFAVVLLPVSAEWRHSGALQAFVATAVMPLIIYVGAYTQAGTVTARVAQFSARIALAVYVLHLPVMRTLSQLRWDLHLHGLMGVAMLLAELLLPIVLALFVTARLSEPFYAFLMAKLRIREVHRYS
jgi:peptidoglycan/LPS O-acetylase OafA/YrhL